MTEQEKLALRELLSTKSDRNIIIDLAVQQAENNEEHREMRMFLWGNGKLGFVNKVTIALCGLTVLTLLALGMRGIELLSYLKNILL